MNYTSKRYIIGYILLLTSIIIERNINAFFSFQRVFQNDDETKQIALFLGTTIQNFLYFAGLGAVIAKLIENRKKNKNKGEN